MPGDATRSLLRWISAHDMPSEIVLVCARAPLPNVARDALIVQIDGGLQAVTVALPAQLLAMGVPQVSMGECDHAHQRPAPAEISPAASRSVLPAEVGLAASATDTIAAWRRVLPELATWTGRATRHVHRHVRRSQVLRFGQVPVPRRVVLGLGVLDTVVGDSGAGGSGDGSRAALDLSLDDEARALDVLHLLEAQGRADLSSMHEGPDGVQAPATIETGGAELVADGCVACGVCVRACPHEALSLEFVPDEGDVTAAMGDESQLREASRARLVQRADQCRGELECVSLCPVDALASEGRLSAADSLDGAVRELAVVPVTACERCGMRHPASEGALCKTCSFRDAHAFGTSLPPGLMADMVARSERARRG